MPDHLADLFTDGELAALSVIAEEVAERGRCTLPMGKLAAFAGVSESTARNAIREARSLKLIEVEERPQYRAPHLPNVVTIISKAWTAWIERRPATWRRGGGFKRLKATPPKGEKPPFTPQRRAKRNCHKGFRKEAASLVGPPEPIPDAARPTV